MPMPGSGEIPTPELLAAWVALGIVPAERVPLWAAHWLIQGHDGAAVPDSGAAAVRVAFTKFARMCLDGRPSEADWGRPHDQLATGEEARGR